MRVFVTGANGWIGSALVPELLDAGHQVVGLARSDAAAAAVEKLGADVLRGDLADLETLKTGAENADGVVHLAFGHDFSRMDAAIRTDAAAVDAMTAVLEGKPFVAASGTPFMAGRAATSRRRIAASARPSSGSRARCTAKGTPTGSSRGSSTRGGSRASRPTSVTGRPAGRRCTSWTRPTCSA
jgi:NAD(P)-dependent dehydrogenase (short-subunit alcohol dehydrogenase family)